MPKLPDAEGKGGSVRFRFSAIDHQRQPVKGVVVAPHRDAAQQVLLAKYAHLFSLEEIVVQDWSQLVWRYRDTSGSLPVYTRALSVMLDAGLPMTSMFDTVAQGDDPYLNRVMQDVASSLRGGKSLSASLARWNTVFDSSFLGMCRAAEKSGRLHYTMRSLALILEKRWRLNQQLRAAFTYPIVVSVVALAVFWILVAVVVPGLVPNFQAIGAKLPWPTRVLVSLSELTTSLPALLGLGALGLAGLVVLYRVIVAGEYFPELHLAWDRFRLRWPLFGELFHLTIMSRTLATMAALFESGLPLTDILNSAGQVSGSPVYQKRFLRLLADVREGSSLAEGMAAQQVFPPLVVGIVALGEESGRMPSLLSKIAEMYEEDLELRLSSLTKLLEPLLLGFMGLVIGFIVLGTFMPMINLIQQVA